MLKRLVTITDNTFEFSNAMRKPHIAWLTRRKFRTIYVSQFSLLVVPVLTYCYCTKEEVLPLLASSIVLIYI